MSLKREIWNVLVFLIHPISVRKDVAGNILLLMFARAVGGRRCGSTAENGIPYHRHAIATGSEAEGWFVGCPLTPRQFLTLDTRS